MSECCYFCDEYGDFVKAVAEYVADDYNTYAVCKKHLKHVKEVGKDYKIIDDEFEDEEDMEVKK